jgi:hypothetical protein
LIVHHTREQALAKRAAQLHRVVTKGVFTKCSQCGFYSTGVTLSQSAIEPTVSDGRDGTRALCPNRVDDLVDRARIGFPVKIETCSGQSRVDIVWIDGESPSRAAASSV